MQLNFKRHLLIAGLLFVGAVGFVAYWNWDTVSTMVENASALNEGGREAGQIRSPDDFLAYLTRHADRVSLVALDGAPEDGAPEDGAGDAADRVRVAHNADARRPIVALPRLQLVAESLRRIDAGTLNPDRRVPLDALDAFSLPGITESAHTRAVDSLRARGQLQVDPASGDTTVALSDVVASVVAFNDEAAADWLLLDLGREAVAQMPSRLGLAHSDPPRPTTGTYLMWTNHTIDAPVDQRVDAVEALSDDAVYESAFDWSERLRADTSFRRHERDALAARGSRLSLPQQRNLARTTYAHGTAADYARLLARVADTSLVSAPVARRLQRDLEQSVVLDSVQTPVTAVATKSGAYPGLMSFAGYARRPDGQPTRSVALFLDDVPLAVVYHLVQTGIDKGFQLQLLIDDAYAARVRDSLGSTTNAKERMANRSARYGPPRLSD